MTPMDLENALQSGNPEIITQLKITDENVSAITIEFEDITEFHTDDSNPWTSLERTYHIKFDNITVYTWWEKYNGYYGCGGTGWWVENIDGDGPSEQVMLFLDVISLKVPTVTVPKPDL
jgi:hypothetical protein